LRKNYFSQGKNICKLVARGKNVFRNAKNKTKNDRKLRQGVVYKIEKLVRTRKEETKRALKVKT